MKKKLLFVIPSLRIGGAEKSFVNLLSELDHSKYDVDVFLLTQIGELIEVLPQEVKILSVDKKFEIFSSSFLFSVFTFLIKGKWTLAYYRLCFAMLNRREQNPAICEQKSWKYLRHFFSNIPKEYDVAIGYLEKTSTYFVWDKVKAKNKIAWIHTDIEVAKLDLIREYENLQSFNHIVTVSENLEEKLKIIYPDFSYKITSIENIISVNALKRLASETIPMPYTHEFFNVLYVGRIAKEKGLFNALEAIHILIEKGYKIAWYLIGWGDQEDLLKMKAKELNLEKNIHFLGAMSNPYPYLKNADAFILPSFFEGKSIALEEAKLLEKPIVITNFTTANSQIIHQENGLIAEMTPESIAENLEILIQNQSLRERLAQNLKKTVKSNENEVLKFYKMID
ncbi:glycosyltransferase [Cloacibacterium sp.]|uniref:glycosyltransferase n=1 Tax=Cloacibacterium sp. TaxID=1913682 RepID=UPI0039E68A1A